MHSLPIALKARLLKGFVVAQMFNEQQGGEAAQVGLNTVLGVFAPLLQQFILEGKAAEDSGHDIKQVGTSWLGL